MQAHFFQDSVEQCFEHFEVPPKDSFITAPLSSQLNDWLPVAGEDQHGLFSIGAFQSKSLCLRVPVVPVMVLVRSRSKEPVTASWYNELRFPPDLRVSHEEDSPRKENQTNDDFGFALTVRQRPPPVCVLSYRILTELIASH